MIMVLEWFKTHINTSAYPFYIIIVWNIGKKGKFGNRFREQDLFTVWRAEGLRLQL